MISSAKNKEIQSVENVQNKSEFFFAGEDGYEAMNVSATSYLEALETYKKTRVKIIKN